MFWADDEGFNTSEAVNIDSNCTTQTKTHDRVKHTSLSQVIMFRAQTLCASKAVSINRKCMTHTKVSETDNQISYYLSMFFKYRPKQQSLT